MTRKKTNTSHWLWGAAAAGLLYYLFAGAGREKNAVLVPDAIEDQLDLVVDSLNSTFGNEWAQKSLSVLETAIAKTLPPPLIGLVGLVYHTELWAKEQQTATGRKAMGLDKRQYAIRMLPVAA